MSTDTNLASKARAAAAIAIDPKRRGGTASVDNPERAQLPLVALEPAIRAGPFG